MPEPKLQDLIRLADLPRFTGLKRTAIGQLIERGEFPRPIKLTDEGHAKAWLASEVLAWQARRIAKRDQV